MPEKINFTKANLDKIDSKGKPRRWVYDNKTAGLAMMITGNGAKSFYVYRWLNGKPQRVRLGAYPEMTPEQGRDAADRVNGQIADGVDPAEQRRARRLEMTMDDIFKDWLKRHGQVHKKSWERDEERWDDHAKDIKQRKLSQVNRSEITTLHTKLGADVGPYLANRVLALLSSLFNWAQEQHGYEKPNPCKGIKKFREQSRERFVQADELPRFFDALKTEPSETMRDFFWLLLLTGARRNNVASMKWADLNLQAAQWIIPDTKGGFPVTVHLSEPAIKILRVRQGNGDAHVFPSHGATGYLREPKKAWKALLERAKLDNLRIHDLRRTLGSWQAAMGASLPIIGKSLGHKNQATTAIYARLNLAPVKQSVDLATAAMLATAIKPKGKKNGATSEVKALPDQRAGKGRKKTA